MPNTIIEISFAIIQGVIVWPGCVGQNVISSMMGGKIKAKVELLTAPTKEITAPKFGTAEAKKTATRFAHYEPDHTKI
jgi:hypothetical protein